MRMSDWCSDVCSSDQAYDEATLKANPVFQAAVRAAVDAVNRDLTVTEKVRRFIFAEEHFSIENEEMTPSMKIRRHVIRARSVEKLDEHHGGYAVNGLTGRMNTAGETKETSPLDKRHSLSTTHRHWKNYH